MNTGLLIFTILLLISLIISFRAGKIIYLKKLALPFIAVLFILCLFFFSQSSVKAAANGINLWLNVVFPSLFPFFVVSELLNSTGFVRVTGILLEPVMRPLFKVPGCGSFAFLMGVTSGYPVGARITAGMREEKLLTKVEAERLLAFSNNSGPLFIIGAVSVGMFKMPELGLFLFACHILACITVGILFGLYGSTAKKNQGLPKEHVICRFKKEMRLMKSFNIGTIFGDAIRNSVSVVLAIGGFIIFFSVIINLLLVTGLIHRLSGVMGVLLTPLGIDQDIIASLLSGFFEITTGTHMASNAISAPFLQKLTAASIIIGWAGLSVHSQVIGIVSKTDISIKPYLAGKCLQGLIAGFYTFVGVKIAGNFILRSKDVFQSGMNPQLLPWHDYLLKSSQSVMVVLCLLAAASLISILFSHLCTKYKKLF